MPLHPTLHTTYTCWVDAPPEVVEERLQEAVDTHALRGSVGDRSFRVQQRVPGVRNSWRPVMNGHLVAAGGGTLVEARLGVAPFVLVFTVLHALLMFGIAYVMALFAFSGAVPNSTRALFTAVEAVTDDPDEIAALQEVADPEEDGAEARAPWSLSAEADLDEVRFTVRGARSWVGAQPATLLTVTPSGVRIGDERLGWRTCDARETERGPVLVLGDLELDAGGHPLADVVWLAAYLSTRRGLPTASPEDEARARSELARLRRAAERQG